MNTSIDLSETRVYSNVALTSSEFTVDYVLDKHYQVYRKFSKADNLHVYREIESSVNCPHEISLPDALKLTCLINSKSRRCLFIEDAKSLSRVGMIVLFEVWAYLSKPPIGVLDSYSNKVLAFRDIFQLNVYLTSVGITPVS